MEQTVTRLRAERDQLMHDNEVLARERKSAIAHAENAQRKARALPDERKSALRSLNEALKTALSQSKEAIAAMDASAERAKGRAAKRLEASRGREALAIEAAAKAQSQRDELVSDLEAAKRTIERLSDEIDALTKARAAEARGEPAVSRSPPAKGGLPKVRPEESDDSDGSVLEDSAKVMGRSSADSDGDGEDEVDGSESDSAKSTAARRRRPNVDELAKDDPDLAFQLQLVDDSNAFKYRIAHGRPLDAEASSDDSGDADYPVSALARGGARLRLTLSALAPRLGRVAALARRLGRLGRARADTAQATPRPRLARRLRLPRRGCLRPSGGGAQAAGQAAGQAACPISTG